MKKKKQQLFTDKYGITYLKEPISEHDKNLLNQISILLKQSSKTNK